MKQFSIVGIVAAIIGASVLMYGNLYRGWAAYSMGIEKKDFDLLFPLVMSLICAILIYLAIATKNFVWAIIFVFLLAIYNPVSPFIFTRATQQGVNGVAAALLLISIFFVKETVAYSLESE